jgi:hypothetical protein
MNDALDDLKRDYRAVSAPPNLATRIHASVSVSRSRSSFWIPAAATGIAILALAWIVPFTSEIASDVSSPSIKPSMSALAALKPSKPTTPLPNMSQLRSVSVPRMPAKPGATSSSKSRTNYQYESTNLKEKNDVYI